MPILKGFPPSNTISPSVRITEVDLTLVTPTTSFHRIGLVGFASKGPVNTPTSVTSLTDLVTKFGNPHPDTSDPYLIYAAQQALRVSNDIVILRVADTSPTSNTSASTASADFIAAGGVPEILGSVAGDSYTFADPSYFSWKLNGVLASKVLEVDAINYTLDELISALNSQLVPEQDGIEFFKNEIDPNNDALNTLGLRATWAYGPSSSVELISIQDSIYGGGSSVVGMGTSMTVASVVGTEDYFPNDGYTSVNQWNFSGYTGLNLQVVVSGTGNVNIDDVVQVISLANLEGNTTWTTAQVVAEINAQIATLPGGFVCVQNAYYISFETLTYGRDSKLVVKSESTADVIFGLSNVTVSGNSPTATSGDGNTDTAGIIKGDTISPDVTSVVVSADSPGIEGNLTSIVVTNDLSNGTFTIKVFSNGASVESWGSLTKNQDSSFYAPTYVNSLSNYIRITDNTAIVAPPANTAATGILLAGGSDGIPVDPDTQDDIIIGNSAIGTGMYGLAEPEQIDIDLLAAPGRSSTTVVQALIDVAQNYRQDCLAIIDPPFGLGVQEIVDWQNGVHPLNNQRFDSDFAALYWPWLQINDIYNNIPVWVPPSGSILATIANSDNQSAPWFAPAGLNRGQVPNVGNVYYRPTLQERDLMYGNQNAVNPVITYPNITGFVVWGQKTLHRTPTALDRVNVRRMLIYVEKQVKQMARTLMFEPNTADLRARFVSNATTILSSVLQGNGITDFSIKCDEELNTPDVIDRNELRARIALVPTKSVEFVFIEFSLNRTGTQLAT